MAGRSSPNAQSTAPPLFTLGFAGVALARLDNLRVRRFILAIPTLPRALDGITIAYMTDLHLGRLSNTRAVREMVRQTNALRPNLVFWTGGPH